MKDGVGVVVQKMTYMERRQSASLDRAVYYARQFKENEALCEANYLLQKHLMKLSVHEIELWWSQQAGL